MLVHWPFQHGMACSLLLPTPASFVLKVLEAPQLSCSQAHKPRYEALHAHFVVVRFAVLKHMLVLQGALTSADDDLMLCRTQTMQKAF